METRNQTPSTAFDLLSPLAGWEAAARWNRTAFDWMAKGWQQWLALATTVPPHWIETLAPSSDAEPLPVAPARLFATPAPRSVTPVARATAKSEPKRPARAKPVARAKPKSNKAPKARTRG